MIVLGIDSSTDCLGIGLADENGMIHEDTLDSAQEHASQIIGMIDSVLSHADIARGNLGGIAVADGPGSFTGLRIGMAVAKGLAIGMNLPIVGVSTFEVVAGRLMPEMSCFYLTAMVRKGELYLCRVEKDTAVRSSIVLINQEDIAEKIDSEPVGLIGRKPEGWDDLIDNHIAADKTVVSGGELAFLGAEMIAGGQTADPATLEPFYIAPSQAERKFGK